jgi:hypothetical protein
MANAERADLLANYKAVCKELREAQERLHTQQVCEELISREKKRKKRGKRKGESWWKEDELKLLCFSILM